MISYKINLIIGGALIMGSALNLGNARMERWAVWGGFIFGAINIAIGWH